MSLVFSVSRMKQLSMFLRGCQVSKVFWAWFHVQYHIFIAPFSLKDPLLGDTWMVKNNSKSLWHIVRQIAIGFLLASRLLQKCLHHVWGWRFGLHGVRSSLDGWRWIDTWKVIRDGFLHWRYLSQWLLDLGWVHDWDYSLRRWSSLDSLMDVLHHAYMENSLEEISTQNGPFSSNSNSMSSCVSQWNWFKFEILYRYKIHFPWSSS